MSDQPILVERHKAWAEVILNRPARKNALTGPLIVQLREAVESLSADDSIQLMLLRGAEGSFTSGHDLKELQMQPPPDWAANLDKLFRAANIALFEFPKPIVGALERFAINAGAALALSCDILVAGESAFLQTGEIQQGAGLANNAAWLRLRVGEAVAARIAYYGDRVPAAELHRMGLATEVVPDADVVARAAAIAERIAGFPAGAPARIKAAVRAQSGISDPHLWFHEQSHRALLTAGFVS